MRHVLEWVCIMDTKAILKLIEKAAVPYYTYPLIRYTVWIITACIALLFSYKLGVAVGKFVWNINH